MKIIAKRVVRIFYLYAYEMKKSIRLRKFTIEVLQFTPHFFYYAFSNMNTLGRRMPWISFKAYYFLKKLNMKNFSVFEFGSGGSSLFFSLKSRFVYSVEHDKGWYEKLNSLLYEDNTLGNLTVKLIEPEEGAESEVVSTTSRKYDGYHFEQYSKAITHFPDETFDLIFIDGRVRPFCLANSVNKLKKGGYLVFDNADRESYQISLATIEKWKILDSYGPTVCHLAFSQTNIYKKPEFI